MMSSFRQFRLPLLMGTAILLACCSAARSAPPAKAATDKPFVVTREAVDRHIAARVEMLWKVQNAKGNWESGAGTPPKLPDAGGGKTALVLMGLKAAGVDEQDPRFQKGLASLVKYDGDHTYTRAMRACLYSMLKDERYHEQLRKREAPWLLSDVRADGMYSYGPPTGKQEDSKGGDYSNTQYGVLGIWAAADVGFEVPQKYWQLVMDNYLRGQARGGGWGYQPGPPNAYGSMTAGGLATLFLVWERLYIMNDRSCKGRANPELYKALDHGLNWMAHNFSITENPGVSDWRQGYVFYYFYGLERVGVASGLKYFGGHDWYKEITAAILSRKIAPHADYTRGNAVYGWELMFLSYGRAPVVFNKLQYGRGWNEHPRDFAGLCRYMGKIHERHFNWQIMPIEADEADFHDAPILGISGEGLFTFKPDEIAKIRTFLDRGGTLFGEAVGGNRSFYTSFANLCRQLYPQLELERLGRDHPIYRSHFQIDGQQVPELMGVSDGVRTPIIFSPKDISCAWQRLDLVAGKDEFQLGENLTAYASDGGQLWSKEESYWPADLGNKPDKTVTVGRLIHSVPAPVGNAPANPQKAAHLWNPSGGQGWVRLDILSRNGGGPAIATKATDLSEPLDPKAVPVLHVTGIGQLVLDDKAKTNLKAYVTGGGLLLADAAGGNKAFAESFGKLAGDLFGQPLVPAAGLPFMEQACEKDGKAWYRHMDSSTLKLPRTLRPLAVQGLKMNDTWNVLLVPCDVTYALNGAPATDPAGLTPDSATKLVRAVLDWRAK
ncbi:MAG: hypothetical protein BIFFINMI_02228 [Phycisphaerae bacterium]|nr:hypothetical protein [Phycisphaerae bacterium]